jgi:hypothetical protein
VPENREALETGNEGSRGLPHSKSFAMSGVIWLYSMNAAVVAE